MAWIYLIAGGLFEIGFTTALRFVEGFRLWVGRVGVRAGADSASHNRP